MVFEYIQERFRTAYKYFACPQKRDAAGCHRGQKMGKRSPQMEEFERKEAALVKKEEDEGKNEKSQSAGWHNLKENEESDSNDEDNHSDQSTKKDETTLDVSLMDMALSEGSEPSFSPKTLLDSVEKGEEEGRVLDKDVTSEELYYVFDKMIFTGGKVIIKTHIYPVSTFVIEEIAFIHIYLTWIPIPRVYILLNLLGQAT